MLKATTIKNINNTDIKINCDRTLTNVGCY